MCWFQNAEGSFRTLFFFLNVTRSNARLFEERKLAADCSVSLSVPAKHRTKRQH